jgi:hypothetical protein
METANSNITPTTDNEPEVNILTLEGIQFGENTLGGTGGHRLFRTRRMEHIGQAS